MEAASAILDRTPAVPMRILMSASHVSTVLESEYAARFEDLGCTLGKHYGSDEWPSVFLPIVRRGMRRLFPTQMCRQANVDLIRQAETFGPEVVWLFKGMDIFPETVRQLRLRGFRPIAYNADHPFEFSSRGSGNSNVAGAIPEYELYMTFSRHIAAQLSERFPQLETCVVPFGHAVDEATYSAIFDVEERNQVCFVGTPDQHRCSRIAALLRAGVQVDIYGVFWEQFIPQLTGARFFGPVYGLDMYRTLRRYRVQLNFLRPHNAHSHNMRSFEAPACGAIMLAEDTVEHREFFEPETEAFYFGSDDEMVAQARRLLALSPEEAGRARTRARARSVNSPYSYRDRAAEVLGHMRAVVGL